MHTGVPVCAQSCPTLCDPTACSLPGSSVHGIIPARILEWVAIFSFMAEPPGNPIHTQTHKLYSMNYIP